MPCPGNARWAPEQAQADIPTAKIDVTSKPPVGDISVVILIRTDTTLDHSQKAEKVYLAKVFATAALAALPADTYIPSTQRACKRG